MKRLYACIGFTMFITFAIVFYFEFYGTVAVCAISLLLITFGLIFKKFKEYKSTIIFIAIVAILSNIYSVCYTNYVYEPKAEKYLNETVEIQAVISSNPQQSYNTYFYEVDTIKINGKDEKLKLMLTSPAELDAEYKDLIKCDVTLLESAYPGYKSQGIVNMAQSPEYYLDCEIAHVEDKGIGYIPIQIRKALVHSVKTLIPGDEGDLCSAIALGNKRGLTLLVMDEFEHTGLTHIIVVSGMHLSILVAFALLLMKGFPKLRRYNIVRFIVVFLLVITFVSITDFERSAIRSGIMVLIVVLGQVVRRQYDALNGLGVAAIIQSIANPYIIADVGVLLSYSAVLGIILLYKPLHSFLVVRLPFRKLAYTAISDTFKKSIYMSIYKLLLYFTDLLILSLSAVIFIMPITAMFFESITPGSVILSVLVAPAVSVVLLCTLACSIIWYIPLLSTSVYPLAFVSYYLAKYVLLVIKAGISLGLTRIFVNSIVFVIWFIISAVSIIFAVHSKDKRKNIYSVITCSCTVIVIICLVGNILTLNTTKLKIYPCGKGMTVVFESNNVTNVLSCGGEGRYTTKILNDLHISDDKINLLVVPSARNTEARYASDILSEFDVDNILLYYMSSTDEETFDLANQCENYHDFTKNETYELQLTEDFTDVIINVDNHTYQYIYNDELSVLLVPSYGDCEEIPEKYRSANAVVVCEEPKNLDILSYGEIIWSSKEQVPENIEDVKTLDEEILELTLK